MRSWSRLVLAAAAAAALAAIAVVLAPQLAFDPASSPGEFAGLLVEVAEIAVFCGSVWLALATTVSILAAARGAGSLAAHVAIRITPRCWARILGVAVGGAVTLAPVAAPAADDGSSPPPGIVGLRLPDRPTGSSAERADDPAVVVRRGDTLWRIAAAHLATDADNAAIARAWRRWYAANRDAIGPDPDLLLPGTRLDQPSDDRKRNP